MTKKTSRKKIPAKSSRLGHDPFSELSVDEEANVEIESRNLEPLITDNAPCTLQLPSNFTIAAVGEIHNKMTSIFGLDKTIIEIDGGEVESVDTAGIQLLHAFENNAMAKDKEIYWIQASEKIATTSEFLGINVQSKSSQS